MLYNINKGVIIILEKYKKILAIFGSMTLIVVVFQFTTTGEPKAEVKVKLDSSEIIPTYIKVHIDGAVETPGVYELEDGSRLEEAIKLAGGLSDEANEEFLNYAQVLKDGEKITVLKKIIRKTPENSVDSSETSAGEKNMEESEIPIYENGQYTVLEKINYMTKEDFQKVPGIGEKISEDIIAYREKNEGFASVEDLKNVSGIGDAKLAKIIEFLN